MKTRAAVLRKGGEPWEITEGYQDMMDGKNLRGVIIHEH